MPGRIGVLAGIAAMLGGGAGFKMDTAGLVNPHPLKRGRLVGKHHGRTPGAFGGGISRKNHRKFY